ncbi:MAG: hypothetical protein ABIF06_01025 [bacterium]
MLTVSELTDLVEVLVSTKRLEPAEAVQRVIGEQEKSFSYVERERLAEEVFGEHLRRVSARMAEKSSIREAKREGWLSRWEREQEEHREGRTA